MATALKMHQGQSYIDGCPPGFPLLMLGPLVFNALDNRKSDHLSTISFTQFHVLSRLSFTQSYTFITGTMNMPRLAPQVRLGAEHRQSIITAYRCNKASDHHTIKKGSRIFKSILPGSICARSHIDTYSTGRLGRVCAKLTPGFVAPAPCLK